MLSDERYEFSDPEDSDSDDDDDVDNMKKTKSTWQQNSGNHSTKFNFE